MNSARIRMRHLRCFLAVARHGSVTRAADTLGTVQPSVSRSIRELEEEVGAPLFDRSAGGLSLNAAGQTFFTYVSGGLGQVDRGIEAIRGAMGERRVSIFALPNVVRLVMPGAVRRFKALYPDVDVELLTFSGDDMMQMARLGRVDFIFGRLNSAERMQGLSFEHLYSEPLAFFVRAGHPLAGRDDLTIHDIDRFLVGIPIRNTIIRTELDRFIIGEGLSRFSNSVETVSFEFTRNIAQASEAVVCQPLGAMRREMAEGSIVRLNFAGDHLMGAVGVTRPADRPLTAAAEVLIQMIRDEVEALGLS